MPVPLSSLKLNPKNPRFIKDERFKKLVSSIDAFPKMMPLRPIVIDDDNMIIGGNMRFQALKQLGYSKIPDEWIKKASDFTQEERERFIIVDNVGFGENDWDMLANDWDQSQLEEWGMEIPDFAFKQEADEDGYEMPEEIKTDIIEGDIFEIYHHRLICGDSKKSAHINSLMDGKRCIFIFTDPPYGVGYENKSNNVLGNGRASSKIAGDNSPVKEIAEKLWRPAFKNMYDVATDDCVFYMTMCQGGDQMMMMMMMSEHWQVKHELIWIKNSPVFSMGRLDYDYQHEPIIYGWKKKHNWYGLGEYKKSVWDIPKPSKSELHPTMKPIKLIANALLNSSKENDICLDVFGGSGSTMIACHQLNRIAYISELEPKYCQVIIDRMRKLDPNIEIKKNGVALNTPS